MKKLLILSILIISAWNLPFPGMAQEFPAQQNPPRMVNDFAGFLTAGEAVQLEDHLVQFNLETSTQIAIVVVPTVYGYDIDDYAVRLAEQWGIGRQGKDNGILILVKPKTKSEKGEISISTGYGLEAVVPDAIAKRIIEVEILPQFRDGNYYQGLLSAANTLMSLTRGEYTADEYAKQTKSAPAAGIGGVFALFLFIMFVGFISRTSRRRHHAVGSNLPFWTLLFLAGSSGRSHSGSFGNFSSGGGGFGGFGGGSFGGGGASGSW